ncbi:DNA recombination protein RmuC [Spirillospora sp. NPDC049652]
MAQPRSTKHALGQDIHSRLGTLGGHLRKLGRSLDSSVTAYNSTIGSLEGNVLPAARRFKDLKILSKDLDYLDSVDSTTRTPKAPELMARPPTRSRSASSR